MSETCTWIVSRFDIVGIDQHSAQANEWWSCACVRPADHKGPHLIKRIDLVESMWSGSKTAVNPGRVMIVTEKIPLTSVWRMEK